MKTGIVKWFSDKKGYGFIVGDDGADYFLHFTGISGPGFRSVPTGAMVEFDIKESDRGPVAVNVTRREDSPDGGI